MQDESNTIISDMIEGKVEKPKKHSQYQNQYEGFSSERDIVTEKPQPKFNYPTYQKQYHIKYHAQSLLTYFIKLFSKKGYKVTEVFKGKIMLVKMGLCERLTYIFTGREPDKFIMMVVTEEYRRIRRLVVKKVGNVGKGGGKDNGGLEDITEIIENGTPPIHLEQEPQLPPTTSYDQDVYSLESTSIYMYHKIFADTGYSIAKKLQTLFEQTKSETILELTEKESSLLVGGIKEITEDMLQNFNCSRKQLLDILCFCRSCVENYYHDRNFQMRDKDDMDLERGGVEAEILEQIPQTVKAFYQMLAEKNSTFLIRAIFICNFVLKVESRVKKVPEAECLNLGRRLGRNFQGKLVKKIRLLKLWGYPRHSFQDYFAPFLPEEAIARI